MSCSYSSHGAAPRGPESEVHECQWAPSRPPSGAQEGHVSGLLERGGETDIQESVSCTGSEPE